MTAMYAALNTAYFTAWCDAWPVAEYGPAPTTDMLAVALAMPSVEPSGTRSKRGGLKAPGYGSFYLATALRWAGGDVSHGCYDRAYTLATGSVSNKQNNMTGLVTAGLLVRYKVTGGYQVALTEAGLAQVKAIDRDLAKVAKGFTVTARDKLVKAAEKAAKQAATPDKPPRKRAAKPAGASIPAEVTNAEAELSSAIGEGTEAQVTAAEAALTEAEIKAGMVS